MALHLRRRMDNLMTLGGQHPQQQAEDEQHEHGGGQAEVPPVPQEVIHFAPRHGAHRPRQPEHDAHRRPILYLTHFHD